MQRIPFNICLEPRFDESNAYWMARLSRMAYREQAGISRETKIFWDNPRVFSFENESSDAQVCILEYEDKALVGFRGTEPDKLKDWLTDFRFFKANFRGHSVHGGFLGTLESLLDMPRQARSYRDRKAMRDANHRAATLVTPALTNTIFLGNRKPRQ